MRHRLKQFALILFGLVIVTGASAAVAPAAHAYPLYGVDTAVTDVTATTATATTATGYGIGSSASVFNKGSYEVLVSPQYSTARHVLYPGSILYTRNSIIVEPCWRVYVWRNMNGHYPTDPTGILAPNPNGTAARHWLYDGGMYHAKNVRRC